MMGTLRKIGKRFLVASALSLVVMSGLVTLLAGFFAAPQTAYAQTPDQACFLPIECITDANDVEACRKEGCCNDVHCFEPDGSCGSSGGRCYSKSQPTNLIVAIGGRNVVFDLGDYIAAIYTYAVSVAGIFAVVMMMIGGAQYLTSRDNPSAVQEAKGRIQNALVGLGLTLFAYLFLQTINPDLVLLRLPKIQVVKRNDSALCTYTRLAVECGKQYGIAIDAATRTSPTEEALKANPNAYIVDDPNAAGVVARCVGEGCKMLPNGSCTNDVAFRCAAGSGATAFTQACSGSYGSCFQCQKTGSLCGEGLPPCCGGCGTFLEDGTTVKRCTAGITGDPCSPFGGLRCAEGFHCVTDATLAAIGRKFFFSGGVGQCYSGGLGMICKNSAQCDEGLSCGFLGGDPEVAPGICMYTSELDAAVARGTTLPSSVPPDEVGQVIYNVPNGAIYSIDFSFGDEGYGCAPNGSNQVPFLKSSTGFAVGSAFIVNFAYGICTDGKIGSICIDDNQCGSKICAAGLAKGVSVGEWAASWFDYQKIGLSEPYTNSQNKAPGRCVDGKDTTICLSDGDCATNEGYVCGQQTGFCEKPGV